MVAIVARIDGFDPVTGTPVALNLASHDEVAVCNLDGQTWWPTIAKLPPLRYDLFDGSFGGSIETPATSFTAAIEPWPTFGRLALADARCRLWTGKPGTPFTAWTLRFDGRVSAQPAIANGLAEIQIVVDDRWLDGPLLASYAGTTGAEGGAALKGQAKPLAIGAPRYAAGTLIDVANSVFQLHGYGAINNITAALERLARFGPPIADYPSHAALVAAPIPAGRWATALAAGMARLGAPPTGQVSFLVQGDAASSAGWIRLPGAVIARLASLAGGGDRIDEASLATLNATRPYPITVNLTQQTTARELIQRIAASLNCVAAVSWLGKLFVAPVGLGAPQLTLAADGSALPPVASVAQVAVGAPWWRLAIGAERTETVHPLGDVAFYGALVPRGPYSAGTTYREGDIVEDQGSTWLYINPTPTAGNAPPTLPTEANAWWRVLARKGGDGDPGAPGEPGEQGGPGPKGDPGTPGADAMSMAIQPAAVTVACDAAGNPKAGEFDRTAQVIVIVGATDRTNQCLYYLATSGCTATLSSTGVLTLKGIQSNDAYAEVRAVFGSAEVKQRLTLSKVRDASSNTSARGDFSVGVSASTYGSHDTGVIEVIVGPNGSLYASANAIYPAGVNSTLAAKLQYRQKDTSVWNDFAAEVIGQPSTLNRPGEPGDAGQVLVQASVGGPSEIQIYQIRAVLRRQAGSGTNATGTTFAAWTA